jgi:adenylosuccinate synthase
MESNKRSSTVFIVGGLLYGDEGKGTTVDYLAKKYNSKMVVRYGGGPQAAHHVVLKDGTWHCFSQLGSASFQSGCKTLISKYMLVYPQTLVREAQVIYQKGVTDVLDKLYIDMECFLVTPYHQVLNRICETIRSNRSHGSTGLGVGLATDEAMFANPEFFVKGDICYNIDKENTCKYACLQIKDLLDPHVLLSKLKKMNGEKLERIRAIFKNPSVLFSDKVEISKSVLDEAEQIFLKFINENTIDSLFSFYTNFTKTYSGCFVNGSDILNREIKLGNDIIFEGSQGSLLDRIFGIYPHITKSLCSDENAMKLLSEIKSDYKVIKIGVLRVYSSRHGNGPFVTYDLDYSNYITEDHNQNTRWQGMFKLGPFDLVAAKYGIEIFKPDCISLTCIDKLQNAYPQVDLNICNGYIVEKSCDELIPLIGKLFEVEEAEGSYIIKKIILRNDEEAYKSLDLLKILSLAKPRLISCTSDTKMSIGTFENFNIGAEILKYINMIQDELKIPIKYVSYGPTNDDKSEIL